MKLRDDLAKHVSELHNPIDRPYKDNQQHFSITRMCRV